MAILHHMPRSEKKHRRRRRRLKSIAVLPSLFTMGNLILGFAILHFAARESLTVACYLLIAALTCDVLDGRIARMTRRTSDFGGQLDSLADVVSFGIAPAFLVICLFARALESPQQVSPLSDQLLGRTAWFLAAIYVACAALRLARFNVENKHDESAHLTFRGLPSPAAAATIGSLILFHEEIVRRAGFPDAAPVIQQAAAAITWPLIYALPVIAMLIGLLMVSRVPYVHLANILFRGRRPFPQVVLMIVVAIACWSFHQLALALLACAYTLAGLIRYLALKLLHAPPARQSAATRGPAQTADPSATDFQKTA